VVGDLKFMKVYSLYTLFLLFGGSTAFAGAPAPFPPLRSSAPRTPEASAPFLLPDGFVQSKIVDRMTLNRDPDFAPSFGTWDMVALDPTSRFVFIPFEVGTAAGLGRYDRVTGDFVRAFKGNGSGRRSFTPATWNPDNDDFARLDPAQWTPNATVLTGEETTGGRLFEWVNPLMDAGEVPSVRWLSSVASVRHEGLKFDRRGNFYFVDEDNSGSLYRFVPNDPADLGNGGQNFVLSVTAFNGSPAGNWSPATIRTGAASWVPINNPDGTPIPGVFDPLNYRATGGRRAADNADGTPYGRPEDLEVGVLASGNQAIYFAATSEHAVYSVELVDPTNAIVRAFVTRRTTDIATGSAVGSGLANPDNLALGPHGEVYVVEDNNPGDTWAATDSDDDGVAESIARFGSLGVSGSEPSGLILDPNDADTFLVCVMHPQSGNDALWAITTPWDADGDNVVDPNDVCPDSDLSPTVVVMGMRDSGVENVLYADGCTLADLVNGLAAVSRNHGQFTSAVAHLANELLSRKDQAALKRAAARAR